MNNFHPTPIVFAENLIVGTGHVLSLQSNLSATSRQKTLKTIWGGRPRIFFSQSIEKFRGDVLVFLFFI